MDLNKKLVATGFAGALAAAATFIGPEEGLELKPYQDIGKVWTVCYGHTGKDVIPNKYYTQAACDALFKSDLWVSMSGVLRHTQGVTLPEPVLVSFTSFVYNVGENKFKTSTARSLLVQGKFVEACHQLPRWKFAAGLDCSVRANGCHGVWSRRLREEAYCMTGATSK
ncbi:lysozyme [Pseudomonas phage nickie]|uniref:Endolysin n=1 Tax=Pseudomonas phage nickie TaxID=2048977 RepID=A0A2H4P731_9CAUD|nr:endolysin [Pseudomonas phage nickie]ATW57977.1 lysozyme [Pseudomonas phage nickie]